MDKDYTRARQALLDDPATSFWLKRAVRDLETRDPLDSERDAACLASLATLRTQDVLRVLREQIPNLLSAQCHSSDMPSDRGT